MPLRVVTITSPGHFDTHAAQAAALNSGLQLTSDSLLAFQRDLEARGVADRVLIYVWSEFGRRGAENASAGTDHGSAGIGFLIGTKVNGQQIGGFPGVTRRAQQPGQPRARRPTSARSTRRSSSSGSTSTRTRSSRTSRRTSGRRCSSEAAAAVLAAGAVLLPAPAGAKTVPDARPGDGEGVLVRALEPDA